MTQTPPLRPFRPNPPDTAGIISWVHIGDLHMTLAGEQNHRDLISIAEEVNAAFAGSISFVFLPGDVADHGSAAEYAVIRQALEALTTPWCSIVGDHDVHEKSFENFLAFMAGHTRYSFDIGEVRFIALNAFDIPDPGSFTLLPEQLDWLKQQLGELGDRRSTVLLLHCYPSDLKQGGEGLRTLVERFAVRLIDMGHTHYNELANDGRAIYTATRSTGQIEEEPVGFSVTNIDGPVVSWKFFSLGALPAVMITSPADERFITEAGMEALILSQAIRVRAKAWGEAPIRNAVASVGDRTVMLENKPGSNVWEGEFQGDTLENGIHSLVVEIHDSTGRPAQDEIRIVCGPSAYRAREHAARDRDNAIGAWPERGLLGTQLGPNKNGRKW